MNKEEAGRRQDRASNDPFDKYRGRPQYKDPKSLLRNPKTFSKLSTRSQKNLPPTTRRQYSPNLVKRYKADDLVDNDNSGSLWTGNGQEGFLFSKDKAIRNGDIVVLNVRKSLKDEIALELKRSYPVRPRKKKKKDDKKEDPAKAEAENKNAPQVYDKISSVVVEEINNDYLLLRGSKEVLFRGRKRMIEVQTMVNRKDVKDDDTVSSDRVIEQNITVLR